MLNVENKNITSNVTPHISAAYPPLFLPAL